MAVNRSRLDRSYHYVAVTRTVPSGIVELAYMGPLPAEPVTEDWNVGVKVDNDSHPLWADALATGSQIGLPAGQPFFFCALLVGPGGELELVADTYQVWLRLTDTDEITVVLAPEVVTIF